MFYPLSHYEMNYIKYYQIVQGAESRQRISALSNQLYLGGQRPFMPLYNACIADIFDEIADYLEIEGDHP